MHIFPLENDSKVVWSRHLDTSMGKGIKAFSLGEPSQLHIDDVCLPK